MASNIALTGLAHDLDVRAKTGKPIRIGLIGSGEMGTDIVTRVAHMPGIEIGAISELNLPTAVKAVDIAYRRTAAIRRETEHRRRLNRASRAARSPSPPTPGSLLENGLIDVVIDATGVPAVGAEIGLAAMEHGKHLVMMNVEADVTIGAYLQREADRLGVIYTLGAGDEPSSCMELIEFVSAMGHPIVAAGKGKNNPLNIDATPARLCGGSRAAAHESAHAGGVRRRLQDHGRDGGDRQRHRPRPRQARHARPRGDSRRAFQGPVPERMAASCRKVGVVDYSIGKGVAPGVFVIAEMAHPRISRADGRSEDGQGPLFHLLSSLPSHLARGAADLRPRRALRQAPTWSRCRSPVAEVCAVAKKDLQPGESLDAIGEYCYRAWIMTAPRRAQQRPFPAACSGRQGHGRDQEGRA